MTDSTTIIIGFIVFGIGLAAVWIIVRIAASAWFDAKRAHTNNMINKIERLEKEGKHNGV